MAMDRLYSGMPVYEAVKAIVDTLSPRYGEGEGKAMARIIFENIKGWKPVDLAIKANEHLTSFAVEQIDDAVSRLMANEPIQYIFGNTWFYGMRFKVTRDTLIPRPETVELVDIIVNENRRKDLRVLDLCTGSGCIAVALARNLPFSNVTGADISDKALAVAEENSDSLHAGVVFEKADILSTGGQSLFNGRTFDIIVSNPPYIADSEKKEMESNVLDFEPALALFVPDDDPLEFYRAIFSIGSEVLAPDGVVYCEINPLYAKDLVKLGNSAGFGDVRILRDSYGKERFMIARR